MSDLGKRIRNYKICRQDATKLIEECRNASSFEDYLLVHKNRKLETSFFEGHDLEGTVVTAGFSDGCVCEKTEGPGKAYLWVPEKDIEDGAQMGRIYSHLKLLTLYGIKHDAVRFTRTLFYLPVDEEDFQHGILVDGKLYLQKREE